MGRLRHPPHLGKIRHSTKGGKNDDTGKGPEAFPESKGSYLKVPPVLYGLFGLIPYIGTGLGSLLAVRLSSVMSTKAVMKMGFMIDLMTSLVMAILLYLGFINLWVLIICGFVFMFGNCIIISSGASVATSNVENKANASAVMQFINVSMPMIGTFLIALFPGSPMIKLSVGFLIAMFIMMLMWFFVINRLTIDRKQHK